MKAAAEDHDASPVGKLPEQVGDEQKVANVIGEELQLEPERLLELGQRHDASIGNDAIELHACSLNGGNTSSHRGRVSEVARNRHELAGHAAESQRDFFFGPTSSEHASTA